MGLVQKSFSDIITFSRSSNATRVGPTGLVEYAPHNLLQRSQEFDNVYWTKYQSTVTANSLAAPDGTVTADTLTANSTANCYPYSSSVSLTTTSYTASVYAKAGTAGYCIVDVSDFTANSGGQYFNLQNGTVGSTKTVGSNVVVQSATIQSVGNGWYRCSMTVRLSSATNYGLSLYVTDADNSTNVTNGRNIYLWGAQLAVGPYALDYTPTTSAAVYGPRFDYDGSGVTIVEPVSRNLLTYSEQFDNAAWTKYGSSVTANATASPDGTVNADKLVENSVNDFHYISFSGGSMSSAGTYTLSVFAKAAERSFINLYIFDGATPTLAYFNLANGTIGTVAAGLTAAITAFGNGWYRCSITRTITGSASANGGFSLALADNSNVYQGNGINGAFFWGAQLEVGSTATAYMVSGATNGFRAVPVVSGSATPRGLLVEEQRTNGCTYSEDITNAVWAATNATRSSNVATSPDGTVNADSVQFTDLSGQLIRSSGGGGLISISGSTTYTISVWMKVTSGTFKLKLSRTNAATWVTATVSPELTVTTDWQRFTLTYTSGAGETQTDIVIGAESKTPYTLPATGTVLIWGVQHEAGSFATSYIPTLASTVTRSADVASVNTLSPWFSATEGSLYAEVSYASVAQSFPLACSLDNSTTSYISLSKDTTNSTSFTALIVDGGATQASMSTANAVTAGSVVKGAVGYKANDFGFSVNGNTAVTDTSGTVPTVTKLSIGSQSSFNATNGWIRRIAYYPRKLSSAELQALSA